MLNIDLPSHLRVINHEFIIKTNIKTIFLYFTVLILCAVNESLEPLETKLANSARLVSNISEYKHKYASYQKH